MHANPSKFQAFVIGKSKINNFNIVSAENNIVTIPCENTVKMLGVNFDKDFTFTTHVKDICMKASKQINVLGRLAHLLNIESRMCIFKSFVSCHFSYCSLVWHFCGMHNTQKLEKLQERGLRFVFQDFSSDRKNLLLMSNTSDLYTLRLRRLLTEIFKTVHNTTFSPLQDIFKLKKKDFESRKVFLLEQDRVACYQEIWK